MSLEMKQALACYTGAVTVCPPKRARGVRARQVRRDRIARTR